MPWRRVCFAFFFCNATTPKQFTNRQHESPDSGDAIWRMKNLDHCALNAENVSLIRERIHFSGFFSHSFFINFMRAFSLYFFQKICYRNGNVGHDARGLEGRRLL